jgi:hypothetical protein
MVAAPEISISADEPKADKFGQLWSPGKVILKWPDSEEVAAPSIEISLVAPVRGEMTIDELRKAQVQAAHDVLTAALLSLESVPQQATQKASVS